MQKDNTQEQTGNAKIDKLMDSFRENQNLTGDRFEFTEETKEYFASLQDTVDEWLMPLLKQKLAAHVPKDFDYTELVTGLCYALVGVSQASSLTTFRYIKTDLVMLQPTRAIELLIAVVDGHIKNHHDNLIVSDNNLKRIIAGGE